jgi:iron complex outermembrane recepter protein
MYYVCNIVALIKLISSLRAISIFCHLGLCLHRPKYKLPRLGSCPHEPREILGVVRGDTNQGINFIRLTLLFSLLSFFANAQNSLSGTISDEHDKNPLPGASIYIPDLKKGSTTDSQGTYTLTNLPKGKFLVEIKFIGYATVVQSIDINGATTLNSSLNPVATELNEVVVSGMSHSSELKNNSIPITSLNSQQLIENASSNLIDNISKKAGVSQISTGPAISKPVIRGLGYNRIITLNNGVRQEGQQWGDEHGIEIDEFSIDRVEIIKGAGSLMYGSDGLGGVINFLGANPEAEGTIKVKLISNYQSNNGLFANSIMNAGNLGGIYWQARASYKTAKPYTNAYDGRVFNSAFNEIDLNGFVGISRKWGYSQININSFNQSIGMVEGDRDAQGKFTRLKSVNRMEEEVTASEDELNSYQLFVPKQNVNHFGLSNTTNLYIGPSRFQMNVGYQRNQRKEFGDVVNENRNSLYFDLTTLNYNLVYFLPEKKGWQFSLGTSGMNQQNKNRGVEFLIPEYQFFDWGTFGFMQKHIGKFDFGGGIRFDQRNISIDALYLDSNGNPTNDISQTQKFKAASLTFSNYSASAGVTYQVSKQWTAKVNASRGFRAPNLAELSSNGKHEGTLRYEYGNTNLKAETGFQTDIGIAFNSDHISAEASLFQNNISNYIFSEKLLAKDGTDSIPDSNDPVPAYRFVQGNAQLTGGEFSIDLHPHPLDWLHFENSFSFVNAVNQSAANDSARYLPFIPPARYQSELRANFKKIGKVFSNVFLKTELAHYWAQDRVLLENRTETKTDSYSLVNVGLGTDIISRKGTTLFSIYISANNLFDVAYQNHLSRLKYAADNLVTGRPGVFNIGRNFSFKIVVPILFKKK